MEGGQKKHLNLSIESSLFIYCVYFGHKCVKFLNKRLFYHQNKNASAKSISFIVYQNVQSILAFLPTVNMKRHEKNRIMHKP